MARKPTIQKPGQPADKSGQWRPVKGGDEVTVPKGKRLPPTPKGGNWKLVDPSDNGSGRRR
jgi:hypothetical protein